MRNIFFFLLMILPCALYAQKHELGLNAGLAFQNREFNIRGYASSFKYLYNASFLQVGAELAYTGLSYTTTRNRHDNTANEFVTEERKIATAPAIAIMGLVNKPIRFGKSYAYLGVAAGYLTASTTATTIITSSNMRMEEIIKGQSGCFTAGFQGGAVIHLFNCLSANAEVAYRTGTLTEPAVYPLGFKPDHPNWYSVRHVPLTLGIRYIFPNKQADIQPEMPPAK